MIFRHALIVLSLFVSSRVAIAGPATPSSSPAIPANLEPSSDQTLAIVLTAKGVQIYECRPVPGEPARFEWAFKAPEADLFDAQGQKVGRHYAGPTWELDTGGKVVGRVKAKADAPDAQSIPWLLLEAAESKGEGVMRKVLSIQRVDTVGGKAPAEGAGQAKSGQEIRVEYAATYRFFVPKP